MLRGQRKRQKCQHRAMLRGRQLVNQPQQQRQRTYHAKYGNGHNQHHRQIYQRKRRNRVHRAMLRGRQLVKLVNQNKQFFFNQSFYPRKYKPKPFKCTFKSVYFQSITISCLLNS